MWGRREKGREGGTGGEGEWRERKEAGREPD